MQCSRHASQQYFLAAGDFFSGRSQGGVRSMLCIRSEELGRGQHAIHCCKPLWFPVATVSTTLKNFSRHEKTPGHQAAVKAFLSPADALQMQPSPEAAAPAEWASVWAFFRKERYMEQESTDVVHRAKHRKMQFCLAEALRSRQQKHLRKACCATLSLDEADTRLLVRYTATDASLQEQSGVLGMERSKETGHKKVLASLDRILRAAATTLGSAPPVAGGESKIRPLVKTCTITCGGLSSRFSERLAAAPAQSDDGQSGPSPCISKVGYLGKDM